MELINMNQLADFNFSYKSPIVCAAIHNGHEISVDVQKNLAVSEDIRLMEEDPYNERFKEYFSEFSFQQKGESSGS
ncbi:MAG: hypothetical protein P9M11_02965 [Candidatus Tenebribacter burtonii]|jgi:phosphopantetheinyl transferase|nr:hypothetical protein [Candidatus Tenebribacter burtonii]